MVQNRKTNNRGGTIIRDLRVLILLSGEISLNPGLVCKHQILNTMEWDIFKTKGLHLMHLNINSLLPKIDELRHMARLSNAAVIGIS